jgi:hypothetical protein
LRRVPEGAFGGDANRPAWPLIGVIVFVVGRGNEINHVAPALDCED